MKNFYPRKNVFILLLTSLLFIGWASTGHRIINGNVQLFLPSEMDFLSDWYSVLADHASDADYRKGSDPTEGPKHYIDLDNYAEFISNGSIAQDFDSLVAQHGYSFVMDQGILPWAIIAAYDSVKNCFIRKDWNKAMLFAADLGHYVGDAHMPLHLTKNYDGQYSNQSGIHSRFEKSMINKFSAQIIIEGKPLDNIDNLSDYIFAFIYDDYKYVDSVLDADIYARGFSNGQYNDTYYQKLWEYSSGFTKYLFNDASLKLSSLIYSAWLEAGSPNLTSVENTKNSFDDFALFQNYPNPFNPSTTIKYSIPAQIAGVGFTRPFNKKEPAAPSAANYNDGVHVSLKVYDLMGREVATLVDDLKNAGNYTVNFNAGDLPTGSRNLSSGIYFYSIRADEFVSTRKFILMK